MALTRILIVDDNAVVRTTLKSLIRHDSQFVVIGEADSGQAALAAIKHADPDLVCLDVLMPGMDGIALLERIRKEHERIKVVMITGDATADVVKKALALGARGFVIKPFSSTKVLSAIRQALL